MRCAVDGGQGGSVHALNEEPVSALHRPMNCSAAKHEGWDFDFRYAHAPISCGLNDSAGQFMSVKIALAKNASNRLSSFSTNFIAHPCCDHGAAATISIVAKSTPSHTKGSFIMFVHCAKVG
jgi:hypothetical protein